MHFYADINNNSETDSINSNVVEIDSDYNKKNDNQRNNSDNDENDESDNENSRNVSDNNLGKNTSDNDRSYSDNVMSIAKRANKIPLPRVIELNTDITKYQQALWLG